MALAAQVVRRDAGLDEQILFEQIRLLEPVKGAVRNFAAGDVIEREAFVVVLDRDAQKVFEAVVSLDDGDGRLKFCSHVAGVQAGYMPEEGEALSALVKQYPDFIAALKRRGIGCVDQVSVEGFCVTNFAKLEQRHLRLSRAHCCYVESPGDNPHVRPLEGLVPVVDLNTMKVLRIEDNDIRPIPPDPGEYRADRLRQGGNPLPNWRFPRKMARILRWTAMACAVSCSRAAQPSWAKCSASSTAASPPT